MVVGIILAVARPASTAPITGADGAPVPGSIAELASIEVNGHELGLMIRGTTPTTLSCSSSPAVPGGSELGAMRNHLAALEEHFTVATLDQRGTGPRTRRWTPPAPTRWNRRSMTPSRRRTTCGSASRPSGSCSSASPGGPSWSARRPPGAGPVLGVRRCGPDGQPCRDRPHLLRRHPRLGARTGAGRVGDRAAGDHHRPTPRCSTTRPRFLRARGLPLRPLGQQRRRGRVLGELPRPRVLLGGPGPPPRGLHGHLRDALPPDPRRRPAPGRSHARHPRVLRPGRARGSGSRRPFAQWYAQLTAPTSSWWSSTAQATGRSSSSPTSSSRSWPHACPFVVR